MAGSTKQAQNKGRRSSPKPASDELVLDQKEIMRAMLAMQKGKQREDSGSDDESGRDESEGEASEEEGEGSASEAESSTFAQQNLKRRRSLSLSLGEESEPEVAQPPKQTQGRVEVSRTATSTKTPVKAQPKPTGLQSAPKPAAGTSFEDLGLSQPIIRALASISITKPTEIQSACIGPIMAGRDCIGGAKTGSGKTMAFALPILERIARDPFGVWAVVLTPTRELAYQLTEQFLAIGKPLGLTTSTIVGGMDSMKQAKELEGRPHIIVATPGRLCDLLRSGGVGPGKLSRVKMLVLDEADRMLTPTFAPDLAYLFSQVPAKRQTCLFTATVSEAIMDLANKPPPPGKEAPYVYRVASDTLTVANLKQKYLFIPSQIRDPYLLYILQNPLEDIDIALRIDPKKAKAQEREATMGNKRGKKSRSDPEPAEESQSIPSIVIFTQRCATAHLLHLLLNSLDIPSVPLHSHLTQPQRLLSLARFRAHEVPVLVTTDVGSRGLDIPEVAMVINWDCPRRADDYVHRVGRTARAGRGGVAVTIVTERDVELVKVIEDEVNVKLEELKLNEDTVLEGLNKVSMARRLATMEMHDSGFGERQALNKAKQIKRQKRDATK
ncbi:ATP-dependent RNA helicase DBP8 [Cryptococcus amylolentus CBS 6039]|uniref:ATP-dependent RNA helicase DBP8 n=1 Tax=Cryptococcus amylolentus CBS 6039 TaxID=1295533 RepID=A0A1E3HVP1_9TREE|nr:ATP-dependent RNA helicase DBP8 [Cryptococcus amylolentus CBS 6039]ODN79816.1 ATP-dependent RNA helicase DBP8 [Cryptococcus amylolentus CBS 6039]